VRTLVLGMAAAITGSTVLAIAPDQTAFRSAMVRIGLLLMAAGYLFVANQSSGWRRGVLRSVAGLQLGWLVWSVTRPSIVEALGDAWFDEVGYRLIAATVWWSGIVLLTIAARAWWRPATGWIVVAAVAAVVLEALPWAPYLAPAFDDATATLEPWVRPVRELVTSIAIVVLVRGILRRA
jgi:hypothetical protein